jgi:CBS domain-containing protein
MKVSDLMTAPAHTCRLEDDLSVPACMMWERDLGAVPVVDDFGKAVAMITDRDIAMACCLQDRAPRAIRVSSIVSRRLISVRPDDDVSTVEQAMRAAQVRRVPVIDAGGAPIGVLSLNDLARNVRRNARDSLGPEPIASTLAAICAPRVPMRSAVAVT